MSKMPSNVRSISTQRKYQNCGYFKNMGHSDLIFDVYVLHLGQKFIFVPNMKFLCSNPWVGGCAQTTITMRDNCDDADVNDA